MLARPIEIDWNPALPVFAREPFLRAVGDDCGWIGGFTPADELLCILPYVIIKKAWMKMVRFRVETIPIGEGPDIAQEKAFLTSALDYFRKRGIALVLPASNNAIFRTYPDGAKAIPYGTYLIDLELPEETLWTNIDRIFRQNIKAASSSGVVIGDGRDCLREGHDLIRRTFRRSRMPFMPFHDLEDFLAGLGEYGRVTAAWFQGVLQSFVVFGFSDFAAYAIYAGNVEGQQKGANKLLYWEAMREFKHRGVKRYDFYGARINPDKGSKQEALASFKRRFGADLKAGYMWRYEFHPLNGLLYRWANRLRSGGDVIDDETRIQDRESGIRS